jgi:triosephosphate isomerase (TIM)
MARVPIIGGNWKMNLDLASSTQLAVQLRAQLGSNRVAEVVVFPPAPFLAPVFGKVRGSAVALGAQDIHSARSGAYTGAMSGAMAQSIGCTWTLVGHSERRSVFGDTDERVGKKLTAALACGLSPVLCVGETLKERESGRTFEVLGRQLDVLSAHRSESLSSVVVAYEPVWAIGTGVTATPDQAQETHGWIRGRLEDRLGSGFAAAVRLQYGGSVKPENASAILACPDIDGALVGGASLDARSFYRIVMAGAASSSVYSTPAARKGLR